MDGAHSFGEGHWFVVIGYDQNGTHIRDPSGWDTRSLAWTRLSGDGRCLRVASSNSRGSQRTSPFTAIGRDAGAASGGLGAAR
jgi:hypothetical protein